MQLFGGAAYQILSSEKGNFRHELYDAVLIINGEEAVQSYGKALVKIPLPEDYNAERTAVYYVGNDGSGIHKLDFYIEDSKVCFKTDHFSAYALVDELEEVSTELSTEPTEPEPTEPQPVEPEMVLGDVNNDGKVTSADARKILRVAVKLDSFDA